MSVGRVYVVVPAVIDCVPLAMVQRLSPRFCHSNVIRLKLRRAVFKSYPERSSVPARSKASSNISGKSGVTTAIVYPVFFFIAFIYFLYTALEADFFAAFALCSIATAA